MDVTDDERRWWIAARTARARSAAIAASTSPTADHGAHPGRLDGRRVVGIDRIDDQRGGDRGVEPGDADHRRLVAELGEHVVGGALRARTADDR